MEARKEVEYMILLNAKILHMEPNAENKRNAYVDLSSLRRQFAYPKMIGCAYLVISADYRGVKKGPCLK